MSRRNKGEEMNMVENAPVLASDAFSNPLYRLGYGSQAPLEATEYPLTRLTDNYALLNSMYRSGGIVQSVCEIIPDDMVREWFTLKGDISPDDLDEFDKMQRKTELKARITEGLHWGRLYGGAVGIILIKGQDDLSEPLDIESIMPDAFRGLMILDRWSGVNPQMGLVTDLNDPDFGLPEYYEISAGEGTTIAARVHHSRVIRFVGRSLPLIEKMAELYWGESEIEPIYDDVALYDNVMHNMGNLTFRANVDTMEVQNLDQLFSVASQEQQKRFWNVMQAQSVAEGNFGIRLINKGDQISNRQYTFTGFDNVIEGVQLNLSAKTHIPMTKLFGRAPAGMNATGESDMRNYYDYVDTQREKQLRPILERLLPVLCMSTWGNVPEDVSIDFPPLQTPSQTETANIAKTKAETIVMAFQNGMLLLPEAQKELKKLADETGMFESISDESIKANEGKTYQDVTALQDPLSGLTKGSDEDSPFDTADALAVDFNENHDPKNGRFCNDPSGDASSLWPNNKPLTYVECRAILKPLSKRFGTPAHWNPENLKCHFTEGETDDHSDMYPGWNINNYADWSCSLLDSIPDNNILFGCELGYYRFRYCEKTNDFVKENMSNGVITMFKPNKRRDYYEGQIRIGV